mmetsp:Transcript_360/g.511  ORF Transcript_360/g.511 Transcript_360/m.511 type:complete len:111 (-) Transcript_360:1561-1893(-)|eukprot:CAMPEP_0170130850 /NCGR_PEP_ID=MMETSP0020_2-20130122/22858_1 /TAXON_ID=98059 /ORGANISM="Dinobryon sp., Strain UTEXLB2267" /LENGTH=110 /DNA_ID=CAMNT_0010365733 /DNA_START=476 /DNA_END=808 /DNA_ORIENTATION=-
MRYEDSPLLKMKGRHMQNTQSSNFYALKESMRVNQEVAFDFLNRVNFKSLLPLFSDGSEIHPSTHSWVAPWPFCRLHLLSSFPAARGPGLFLDRVPAAAHPTSDFDGAEP